MDDAPKTSEDEPSKYTIKDKSDDGKVFEVTVDSGPHKGRSATIASISSRFAYYNVDKKAS